MNAYETLYPIPAPLPFQTPGEEIANSILHGLGVLLAIAGLVLLYIRGNGGLGGGVHGGPLAITSYFIFTISMIALFLASTLYHAIQVESAKRIFRIIDHSAVYLLIAGTYTPYSLLGFRGVLGWVYFGIEWGLAAIGIIFYAAGFRFIKKIEVVVYILMGWACILGFSRLIKSIPPLSVVFLFSGGIAYTIGTFFYRRQNRRKTHVTWHAFVLAGAIQHWLSIWFLS
jgi:hemolysin III